MCDVSRNVSRRYDRVDDEWIEGDCDELRQKRELLSDGRWGLGQFIKQLPARREV